MKQKIFIAGATFLSSVLFVTSVHAAESLIFENDSVRPFNAKTLLIDSLDKGGDLTLKFGRALGETLQWDSSAGKFKFSDDVDIQGTMSGSAVHAAGGNVTINNAGTAIFNVNENAVNFRIATDNETNMFFVDGTNDRVGIGTSSPDSELEVVGTISGATIHAQDRLTSSGTLSVDGGFYQDGMTDCDSAGSKLIWDASTGTFSCGSDGGGDLSQAGADDRYVNQAGDTMTGNLVIADGATLSVSGAIITEGNLTINQDNGAADAVLTFGNDAGAETLRFSDTTNGFIFSDDLEVQGVLSGATIHAQDGLTSSGSLNVEGDANIHGTLSGNTITGFNLTDCDNSTTSKLLWDATTQRFICGTDTDTDTNTNQLTTFTLTGDSGSDQTIAHGNTLDIAGGTSISTVVGATDTVTVDITDDSVNFTELSDSLSLDADTTLTFGSNTFTFNLDGTGDFNIQDNGTSVFFVQDNGNIGIGSTTPDTKLEIVGTASGTNIHAQDSLTSSGTLVVEGKATFGSIVSLGSTDYTFPNSDGASTGRVLSTDGSGNLSWALIGSGALKSRVKQIFVPLDTAAVTTDGTDNEMNVYVGSQTGSTVNPHHYYRAETGSGQLQDVHIRFKVALPKDFISFDNANDLSFTYRTHSATNTVNKLDIIVEDDDGDDAFTAADGQTLANTSWTAYTDEFDGGSFNPVRGEYIHITIKAYSTSAGMAYAGELIVNYTAQ